MAKKLTFEIYKDELIIAANLTLIDPLCLLIDGISCVMKGSTVFYRISDVIRWHQNELPHTLEPRKTARVAAIKMFEGIRDQVEFSDDQIVIHNPHPMTKEQMKLLAGG
jgi:hypothetical protein